MNEEKVITQEDWFKDRLTPEAFQAWLLDNLHKRLCTVEEQLAELKRNENE